MTGCALACRRLPLLAQVLLEPALRGGLPRDLDRGRGIPLLGQEAQVVPLAAVLEPGFPLVSTRFP